MANFKTLNDLVHAINTGAAIKAKRVVGPWKKGDKIDARMGTSYVSGAYVYTIQNSTGIAYNLQLADAESATQTKEEIQKELDAKKSEVVMLEAKLKYIEETGQETFDENEFKVWNTLTLVDNKKLTKLEKAKAIAQLIS